MARPPRHHDQTDPETNFEDPLSNYDELAYKDPLARELGECKVAAIDSRPAHVIGPDTTVENAMRELHDKDTAAVLIASEGKLLGVFTERDVLNRVADKFESLRGKPITDVMTPSPSCVYETDSAAAALQVIAVSGRRHVPVLDVDDKVAGVISPGRVLKFLKSKA